MSFVYTQLNDQTVLFQTIQFSKVNWLQVLLCITNNSVKRGSPVLIPFTITRYKYRRVTIQEYLTFVPGYG